MQTKRQQDIQNWCEEWAQIWKIPTLTNKLDIKGSGRLRSSLARCYPQLARIRVRMDLMDAPDSLLKNILCHEMAHLAVWHLYGNNVLPHGREWNSLVIEAGHTPRVRMRIPNELQQVYEESQREKVRKGARTRYLHRCPQCQLSHIAFKRNKQWRCGECVKKGLTGKLEVELLKGAEAPKKKHQHSRRKWRLF